MIPSILHFVWIGPPMPAFAKSCIERFRSLNDDFTTMVHDERILCDEFKEIYTLSTCIHLWAGGKHEMKVSNTQRLPGDKTVVMVANNRRIRHDYCHAINSADLVVRMNRCIGFGDEQKRMGYKTDILGLVSSGSSAKRFTKPLRFMQQGGRVREQVREVWFARPKGWQSGSKSEISNQIIEAQSFGDLKVIYPSNACWQALEKKLREVQKSYVIPSTGMILIEMLLHDPRFRDHRVYLAGFSHQGWSGHPFDAERAVIQGYIDEGRLFRIEDFCQPQTSTIADTSSKPETKDG